MHSSGYTPSHCNYSNFCNFCNRKVTPFESTNKSVTLLNRLVERFYTSLVTEVTIVTL